MDKNTLNNEILLCRPAVRKAKVIVIRKTIKNMKILKTCKNEDLKEKKLRKANNLFARVQLMKKLKDDEVTKFALTNDDYNNFIKQNSKDVKKTALATLAKHAAVVNAVTKIREKIPDWKITLPILLKSNRKNKKNSSTRKINKKRVANKIDKTSKPIKRQKIYENNGNSGKESIRVSKPINKSEKTLTGNYKTHKSSKPRTDMISKNHINENYVSDKEGKGNENNMTEFNEEQKVDDPFFVKKKVTVPKLHQEEHLKSHEMIGKCRQEKRNKSPQINRRSAFNNVSFKRTTTMEEKEKKENEVLHPSWAAKKVKLIKPFEGKKIKFNF